MNIQEKSKSGQKRIRWIDIAKGISIVLVIYGHTVGEESRVTALLRGAIFSFHMPLFFMLSAMTYKWAKSNDDIYLNIKRSFHHLIYPAVVVFILRLTYDIWERPSIVSDFDFWKERIFRLVLSSGISSTYAGINVNAMGIPWFFIALFFSRIIFDVIGVYFDRTQTLIISTGFSLLGIISKELPFSLDVAFSILPLFFVGQLMYERFEADERREVRSLFTCSVIWAVTFYLTYPQINVWSYLELADRRYPLYPICFICAIAGTSIICEISKIIQCIKYISSIIEYIGHYSMYLLIVHCMDYIVPIHNLWYVENNQMLSGIYRIGIDLCLFATGMMLCNFSKRLR